MSQLSPVVTPRSSRISKPVAAKLQLRAARRAPAFPGMPRAAPKAGEHAGSTEHLQITKTTKCH